MDAKTRLAALKTERRAVLDYCSGLAEVEWQVPSRADGWLVRDVVAHIGAAARTLVAMPNLIQTMRSADLEALNEDLVAKRREWPVDRVLEEFRRFSGIGAVVLAAARGPVGAIRTPLGQLGRFPMRLTPALFVFDWHVHLRHDIAPAVGKPAPETDETRLAVVLEWMLAGMEQMQRTEMGWVDRPLALTLHGPAGGTWQIEPTRDGLLRVQAGTADGTAAQISGDSLEFPAWATTRTPWRAAKVSITGDADYATRFLDTLNIV